MKVSRQQQSAVLNFDWSKVIAEYERQTQFPGGKLALELKKWFLLEVHCVHEGRPSVPLHPNLAFLWDKLREQREVYRGFCEALGVEVHPVEGFTFPEKRRIETLAYELGLVLDTKIWFDC